MNEQQNNKYGYKVGYRENGGHFFIRHLVTNTYDSAKWHLDYYNRSIVRSRKDNHILINPIWEIRVVHRYEAIIVWWGCPF